MKIIFLIVIFFSAYAASAQLIVGTGAQFSLAGNIRLTLQNTGLVNNGSFTTGNSKVAFKGDASSTINGSQPIQFFEIEMDKTNNSTVQLLRPINVTDRILLTSGFLDLNGFNADLGSTGHLDGEQENTRIIGPNGGEVLFNVNLNSPAGSNPANLGIFITSGQDLGNVTLKRGHQSQPVGNSTGNSIFRYYDILPANNSNLNAVLKFKYFNSELNGLDENSLVFFKNDGTSWANLGFNSRDTVANFVEKSGISSFGRFTLSNINSPLPVRYTFFNVKCEDSKVQINWKTGQEQNSSHFNIERSADGINWSVIGTLPAKGNSNTESSYSFTDSDPRQTNLYRIAEYDLDSHIQYTSVLRSMCNGTDQFSLWPNPVYDRVYFNIVASGNSPAMIRIFDSKAALVKMQKLSVVQGSNQFNVDLSSLANGVYLFAIEWNYGEMKKEVRIIKQ